MKLKCDIIIQNLNQKDNYDKPYKDSILGIYRHDSNNINDNNNLILTIQQTKTSLNLKYKLNKFETYTKFIRDGKSTINLIDQKILILISNTPSQSLVNFISFLKVKYNKTNNLVIKNDCTGDDDDDEDDDKENKLVKRPSKNSTLPAANRDTFANRILKTMQVNVNKNDLKTISPLTDHEISDLMKKRSENNQSKMNKQTFTPVRANKPKENEASESNTNKENENSGTFRLTNEQKNVLRSIKDGKNVFFTGNAGTGKSFILKVIRKCLPQDSCFVTASTGIAACLIGGTTLHSFSGLSVNDTTLNLEDLVKKFEGNKLKLDNWKKCKHLIIDEISMIDADLFDKLEFIARYIKNNNLPFGGIQLILSGDFLQLPPVTKYNEPKKYCFLAKSWSRCVNLTMHLSQVQRQSDQEFIKLLEEIRYGNCSESTIDKLNKTKYNKIESKGILPTKLCTHKDDVDLINKLELDLLKGEAIVFKSIDSDSSFTTGLNKMCIAKDKLTLKVGAQVMLNKNLNLSNGLSNGSRGIVTRFVEVNNYPVVKFLNGQELTIRYDLWSFKLTSNAVVTRKQLPLQLAWALSIHKSQGMTLDCCEISLSRVFESGQAYVALSRAKSLNCIRVLDFDVKAIKTCNIVLKYYQSINYYKPSRQLNLQDE